MAKRKAIIKDTTSADVTVRVTGPNCRWSYRVIMPGETATVPAIIAQEWIQTGRALAVSAEVTNDKGKNES